jgi:hypothetical protein
LLAERIPLKPLSSFGPQLGPHHTVRPAPPAAHHPQHPACSAPRSASPRSATLLGHDVARACPPPLSGAGPLQSPQPFVQIFLSGQWPVPPVARAAAGVGGHACSADKLTDPPGFGSLLSGGSTWQGGGRGGGRAEGRWRGGGEGWLVVLLLFGGYPYPLRSLLCSPHQPHPHPTHTLRLMSSLAPVAGPIDHTLPNPV